MNVLWALSTLANCALLGMIFYVLPWKRFPIFLFTQMLAVGVGGLLIWAFYAASVTPGGYRSIWLTSDILIIFFESLAAWELLGACWMNWNMCALSWGMVCEAFIKLIRYSKWDTFEHFHPEPILRWISLAVTFAMVIVLYDERHKGDSMSDPKHTPDPKPINHPKPEDEDDGEGETDTGAPDSKP